MSDPLDPRVQDEIDDQVAEAFDLYLADQLAEPGPPSPAKQPRDIRDQSWNLSSQVRMYLMRAALSLANGCGWVGRSA